MGERFRGNDSATGHRAGETNRDATVAEPDHEHLRVVLAYPRRRHILEVLTEDGVTTMSDLATGVAARERGIPPTDVTDQQRRDVVISLYHVHLPKLADAGVIGVDDGMERIRPGPVVDSIGDVLARLSAGREPGDDAGPPTA